MLNYISSFFKQLLPKETKTNIKKENAHNIDLDEIVNQSNLSVREIFQRSIKDKNLQSALIEKSKRRIEDMDQIFKRKLIIDEGMKESITGKAGYENYIRREYERIFPFGKDSYRPEVDKNEINNRINITTTKQYHNHRSDMLSIVNKENKKCPRCIEKTIDNIYNEKYKDLIKSLINEINKIIIKRENSNDTLDWIISCSNLNKKDKVREINILNEIKNGIVKNINGIDIKKEIKELENRLKRADDRVLENYNKEFREFYKNFKEETKHVKFRDEIKDENVKKSFFTLDGKSDNNFMRAEKTVNERNLEIFPQTSVNKKAEENSKSLFSSLSEEDKPSFLSSSEEVLKRKYEEVSKDKNEARSDCSVRVESELNKKPISDFVVKEINDLNNSKSNAYLKPIHNSFDKKLPFELNKQKNAQPGQTGSFLKPIHNSFDKKLPFELNKQEDLQSEQSSANFLFTFNQPKFSDQTNNNFSPVVQEEVKSSTFNQPTTSSQPFPFTQSNVENDFLESQKRKIENSSVPMFKQNETFVPSVTNDTTQLGSWFYPADKKEERDKSSNPFESLLNYNNNDDDSKNKRNSLFDDEENK